MFIDLASQEENKRIETIGNAVMNAPSSSADKPVTAGIIVEDDEKAERYIKKLKEKFPKIRIIGKTKGPGSFITIKVGPPLR